MNQNPKVIFIPGNGGGSTNKHWFADLKNTLESINIPVIAAAFPDPMLARETYWLPFLTSLGADEQTILVGHSSGAVAAMRFAETHTIFGSVLVGACYTDLGDETEKASGYYDHRWDWEAIRQNQQWILQFASTDDPYIPIAEPRFIHEKLQSEYFEYTDKGHFMIDEFPKFYEEIQRKLD